MKTVPASFLAMIAGWAAALIGLALWQLASSGRMSDIGAMGFWVGFFALIAWAIAVLPVMLRFGRKKFFGDLKFSWLGWCLLAVAIYSALLPTIYGREMFRIIWYPAVMGVVAGVVFALLTGKARPEKEPNQPPEPTRPFGPSGSS
jgi:xanthine/uracil permease